MTETACCPAAEAVSSGPDCCPAAEAVISGPDCCPQGPACCPQGLGKPLSRDCAESLAALFRAIADPARLQLLALIGASEKGEVCACDLIEPVGLSQSTVSHHLKILVDAGLLHRESRGTWAWYSLAQDRLCELAACLWGAGSSRCATH
ncbi:MAG: metalloregulator ArsR/SmtB family transcription factor [Candidatus Nanopelagicales bacterium]|nr:metalloregulator ArsR/SmtB family transcription factor [Candidatus Nanopelagicales bacterium]